MKQFPPATMGEMRKTNPTLYERIVTMISIGPKDFRSFQTFTSLSNQMTDAHHFLATWETTGNDTTTSFLQIAKQLNRHDIVKEFHREYRNAENKSEQFTEQVPKVTQFHFDTNEETTP